MLAQAQGRQQMRDNMGGGQVIRESGGFALVEVLLGSLLLAVGAVMICGLCRRCVIDSMRGVEYEQAARLVDECLDEAAATDILTELIVSREIEGDFGDRYPNYRYALELKATDQADLYEVTATVSWEVLDKQYQLEATTLIYDY